MNHFLNIHWITTESGFNREDLRCSAIYFDKRGYVDICVSIFVNIGSAGDPARPFFLFMSFLLTQYTGELSFIALL